MIRKKNRMKRAGIPLLASIAILMTCIGCARTVPMKVHPLGMLDKEDYQHLEAVANQFPAKVGTSVGSVCEPTLVYYVVGGYDFSKVESIYIPDFTSTDRRADETVTKDSVDDLRMLLLQSKLFRRVERVDPSGADIELHGDIGKYQDITGKQTAKVMLTGGIRCGLCEMELRIADSKTRKTIGAIKINYLSIRTGPFMGGIIGWSGSSEPAKQIPGLIATVFEKIKAGNTGWSNDIWYTCIKDDGTSLIDKMCE